MKPLKNLWLLLALINLMLVH